MDSQKNLKYIDLHIHSTCSDGTLSPEEIVKKAYENSIGILAITDHDEISGIKFAQEEAKKYGIKVIPGIECSVFCETGSKHILGYNFDYNNEGIIAYTNRCKANRILRIEGIIRKINEAGLELTFEEVREIAGGGSVGRPHIARAMLKRGYIKTIGEAFQTYIGKGKPMYVPKIYEPIEEVISIIKAAGGVPILAHPIQMNCGSFESTLQEIRNMVSCGIEGVEIVYPEHTMDENYHFNVFTFENGLYITCGSDFHGENSTKQLGKCFSNKKCMSISGLKKLGNTFI